MNLYDVFSYKPKYAKHRLDLITKFAYYGGDKGDAVKKQEAGKHFSFVYEFYIYAALLGFTKGHSMPIKDAPTDTFNDMGEWKSEYNDLGQFIFLLLLAHEDVDIILQHVYAKSLSFLIAMLALFTFCKSDKYYLTQLTRTIRLWWIQHY